MVKTAQIDWVRVTTALGAALLIGLFWWAAISLFVQS
jgi:hypothetical protein